MDKNEAVARIKDHMMVHKLNEPHAHFINEALEMAIQALKFSGCGCDICLIHNNMKCPKMKEESESYTLFRRKI